MARATETSPRVGRPSTAPLLSPATVPLPLAKPAMPVGRPSSTLGSSPSTGMRDVPEFVGWCISTSRRFSNDHLKPTDRPSSSEMTVESMRRVIFHREGAEHHELSAEGRTSYARSVTTVARLDDLRPNRRRSAVFTDQVGEIVAATTVEDVVPALTRVEEAAASGLWAIGYVGYEAAPAFDPRLVVHSDRPRSIHADLPLVWFGVFATRVLNPEPGADLGEYELSEWRWVDERASWASRRDHSGPHRGGRRLPGELHHSPPRHLLRRPGCVLPPPCSGTVGRIRHLSQHGSISDRERLSPSCSSIAIRCLGVRDRLVAFDHERDYTTGPLAGRGHRSAPGP